MPVDSGLSPGPDGAALCSWRSNMPEYHDLEWGQPIADDTRLFEKICLEGFQSGLSWLTILRKRESFRAAFDGFEINRVARFDETRIAKLLDDPTIVRNRAKIMSTINNASCARAVANEFGSLAAWIWTFEPAPDERPRQVDLAYLRANPTTAASKRLSSALKARHWSFVGPTTIYAFMQAVGLVNDHLEGCACRIPLEATRRRFKRPTS